MDGWGIPSGASQPACLPSNTAHDDHYQYDGIEISLLVQMNSQFNLRYNGASAPGTMYEAERP